MHLYIYIYSNNVNIYYCELVLYFLIFIYVILDFMSTKLYNYDCTHITNYITC